jgi:hypothetical protein
MWRCDLAYDRETFEDIDAIDHHIVVNSWSPSVDFRPNRFLLFGGKFKQGFYSDNNRQESVLAKAELRLLPRQPYLKLYYNYYYSDWVMQLNHGYFNPKQVQSHTLGLYGSHQVLPKLFVEAQGSLGCEIQNPTARAPTYFVAAGLAYRLTENWELSLRGEYYKAEADRSSAGYDKTAMLLSIRYNFGTAPGPLLEGALPSRGR